MIKKIIILLTMVSLVCCPTIVFANEANTNSKDEIISGETLDEVFNDMKNSIISGEELSFAKSLEEIGGLTISVVPEYTLSSSSIDWNNLDASLTNLGFSEISASLAGSYNTIDLSGMSIGCTELFNNSFGDIVNSIKIADYSLPSNFNKDDMLNKNKEWITGLYEDAIRDNETYNTVKETIEIGSIFKQASEGPSKKEIKTMNSLFNCIGGRFDNLQKEYRDEANYIDSVYETTTLTEEQQSEQKEQSINDMSDGMDDAFSAIKKFLITHSLFIE